MRREIFLALVGICTAKHNNISTPACCWPLLLFVLWLLLAVVLITSGCRGAKESSFEETYAMSGGELLPWRLALSLRSPRLLAAVTPPRADNCTIRFVPYFDASFINISPGIFRNSANEFTFIAF